MGNINTKYLLQRMSEPSTWRGLVLILTSIGIVSHDQGMSIEAVGLAVSGLVGTFFPDNGFK